jgi:hypothetical protein
MREKNGVRRFRDVGGRDHTDFVTGRFGKFENSGQVFVVDRGGNAPGTDDCAGGK